MSPNFRRDPTIAILAIGKYCLTRVPACLRRCRRYGWAMAASTSRPPRSTKKYSRQSHFRKIESGFPSETSTNAKVRARFVFPVSVRPL
jgi:hypothetical protein